jgi:alkyl hydroperoxide reductase subunit AhpF
VIVATGVRPKELNIPGEKEFRNKGVTYCTVCDGPLFAGKITAVIGGGNSALEAGLMLADIAEKVYVINKNPIFKGDAILLDNLKTKKNVEIIYNARAKEVIGSEFVNGLKYDSEAGDTQELKVDGIFIHIGMVPNSTLVPPETEKNVFGEIVVNKNCETNLPGLYAAGDMTDTPFKQIIIAAGQGTTAALNVVSYLNKLK